MVEGDKIWYIDKTYGRIRKSTIRRISTDDQSCSVVWTVGQITLAASNCYPSEKAAVKGFLKDVKEKIRNIEARYRKELQKPRRQAEHLERRLQRMP